MESEFYNNINRQEMVRMNQDEIAEKENRYNNVRRYVSCFTISICILFVLLCLNLSLSLYTFIQFETTDISVSQGNSDPFFNRAFRQNRRKQMRKNMSNMINDVTSMLDDLSTVNSKQKIAPDINGAELLINRLEHLSQNFSRLSTLTQLLHSQIQNLSRLHEVSVKEADENIASLTYKIKETMEKHIKKAKWMEEFATNMTIKIQSLADNQAAQMTVLMQKIMLLEDNSVESHNNTDNLFQKWTTMERHMFNSEFLVAKVDKLQKEIQNLKHSATNGAVSSLMLVKPNVAVLIYPLLQLSLSLN